MVARRLAPEGGFIFPVGRGRFMAASGLQNDVHFLPRARSECGEFALSRTRYGRTLSPVRFYADYSGLDVEGLSSVRRHLATCGQLGTDSACTGHPFPGCPAVPAGSALTLLIVRNTRHFVNEIAFAGSGGFGSHESPRRQRPQKICSSSPLVKVLIILASGLQQ